MRIASYLLMFFFSFLVFSPVGSRPAEADGKGGFEGRENVLSMVGQVDVTCILRTWRIVGVDVCVSNGTPRACVIVENAYPVGILEAVRKPLASHMAEVDLFLEALSPMKKVFGVSSSHTTDTGSGTGLQFSEAHAFEWVPSLPLLSAALPIVMPPGRPFAVSYFSELDGFGWRTGLSDLLADPKMAAEKAILPACSVRPRVDDCAWSWGSYFPRTGFLTHPSEVMTGYLLSLRAGRVGASPLGRVIESPYLHEPRTGHYIQMVKPALRSCVAIGWPATRMIEGGALSKEGAYLYVHFGIFRECKGCYGPTLAPARPPAP